MRCFADLHVHVGGTSEGKPVKIAASRSLTFGSILAESRFRKGIDIVGIVDCASPAVLRDMKAMMEKEELAEQEGGGLVYQERLVLFPAAEVEVSAGDGRCHFISYFRDLSDISSYSRFLAGHMKNPDLSSQKARISAAELMQVTRQLGGLFFAAHAFTPHKGLIGSCVRHPAEVFGSEPLDGIELGLSADTDMVDRIPPLRRYPFLSNSDAHSTAKIGREYNVLDLKRPTFDEFILALNREQGRSILANYGMDPRLGKYHRTSCLDCGEIASAPPPVDRCPVCGSRRTLKGVLDRIVEVGGPDIVHPESRPPYHYQVPLQFIPGVGPKTYEKLLAAFGDEMTVLHRAGFAELTRVAGKKAAKAITAARSGKAAIQAGGGGTYGRVRL